MTPRKRDSYQIKFADVSKWEVWRNAPGRAGWTFVGVGTTREQAREIQVRDRLLRSRKIGEREPPP